ncbi:CoA-binding protein [Cupriavidus basilensis]
MEAQVPAASVAQRTWSPPPDASDIVKGIHAMLHPHNIVLVGATDKPGNYAERIWNNLVKYGFEGGLYPVNAKRDTIWGVPCYKDFASLPEKPDHVLVLVPARFAVQVIRDAAAAGARSATIVTSGFSELQDEESQKLAAELQTAIRETGLAVTGPNCLGNLSAGEKLFTNIDDRIVTMEQGAVAIAGQSGAIVMAIRQALEDRGVGVGYMVTSGNEAGLETPDLMRYFAEDPSIKVIVVYLEGVRNTKAFRDACKAARAASKPVIALKLGASKAAAPRRWRIPARSRRLDRDVRRDRNAGRRDPRRRAGRVDRDHRMLRSRGRAQGQPARCRHAVRRQARHAARRLLQGRAELRAAQPACRLRTREDGWGRARSSAIRSMPALPRWSIPPST